MKSSFGKTYPLIYDLHNVSDDLQLFSCNRLFLFSMHLSFFTLTVLLIAIILESSTKSFAYFWNSREFAGKKFFNEERTTFGNGFVFYLVCRSKVDLAFVIDGSGSIEYYGKGNFRRCLRFVEMVVSQFNSGQTRVGLIVYSSRPRLYSDFRYRSKRSILSIIRRIRYPRGGTRTGYALNYCYSRLFRKARRGVRKV